MSMLVDWHGTQVPKEISNSDSSKLTREQQWVYRDEVIEEGNREV